MADTVGSPLWWVKRLYKKLQDRRRFIERMDDYYRGEPPVPWLPDQARDTFNRLLKLTKSNYMGLVVDAMVERMQIEGFRIGNSPAADKPTWALWQRNNFDNDSDQLILEAAKSGWAYMLVAPDPADDSNALMFAEHPSQAIVEYEPGSSRRRRAAGLKVWVDDWTGSLNATLYLPKGAPGPGTPSATGLLFKYRAPARSGSVSAPRWEPREVAGEQWPATSPIDVVPLVEIANNPQLLTGGTSEIADVVAVQDRICKTIADRLMTQDFGAFPQKWATGFPERDDDGNENRVDIGRDRMVRSDIAETKFGQWDAAPLDPYSAAKREDVKDIASRTRTPAQYLLGELSNVNGETLKAAESGLVSKVRQRFRGAGEGFEEGVRIARLIAGLPRADDEAMETIWRNPEFRTEGELVDALQKMSSLNVPDEALWERWGATQPEIERWKAMRAEQAELDPVGQMNRGLAQGEQAAGDVDGQELVEAG